MSMFFFPIGMHMSAKYNPKLVLAVSGFITFSSVWASSYTLNPQVFIYCYGLGFGVSKGLLYSTALQSGISHFPGRKGMITGFVVCGFGFGGFAWGLLARYLCNPDDLKPTLQDFNSESLFGPEVAQNVPYMLRTMCSIWIALCIFSILTVSRRPIEQTHH